MKTVTMTYHNHTAVDSNELAISVEDNAEVTVTDARAIGGSDTRFQFVIVTESVSEDQRRSRRARV